MNASIEYNSLEVRTVASAFGEDEAGGEVMAKEHDRPSEQYEEWRRRFEARGDSPRELFRRTSQVALLLSYDLIDKLRWWEKETLRRPEEEVAKRLEHLAGVVQQLRKAYLEFADVDL